MLVLGLLLLLLSAGSLVAVLVSGTDDKAALYDGALTMPTLVVFLLGAGALLLFVVGLELVRSGVKRANANRRDRRRLRKLEREHELRRDSEVEAAAPPEETGAGAAPADPADPATATGSTGQPDGDSGPYQAPPPASR